MKVRFTKRGVLIILGIVIVCAAASPLVLPLFFPDMRAKALVRKLESNDETTRQKAAEELVEIGRPAARPLVEALRRKARRDQWGPGALRSIIEHVFGEPHPDSEALICETLARLGDDASDALVGALNNEDQAARSGVLYTLAIMGADPDKEDAVTEIWARLLSSRDKGVCRSALDWLAGRHDERAVKPLIARLKADRGPPWVWAGLLQLAGTPEALSAVAEFAEGQGAEALAADYRKTIIRGNSANLPKLCFLLERYGTLEMAADLRFSNNAWLAYYATEWARRRGLADELEKSIDSPERPKWGAATAIPVERADMEGPK